VIPVGGTALRSVTAGLSSGPAGAACPGLTWPARYASRSLPLDVQISFPSGETSAHIAFAMYFGSSLT
jgi:hypothetical protein